MPDAAPVRLIDDGFLGDDQYGKPTYSSSFGIGFEFQRKGRECRIAVRIKNSASAVQFQKAWRMLTMAMENPEALESKAVFGNEVLVGNEIQGWEGE